MRKTIIVLLIILMCILISVGFTYLNYTNNVKKIQNFNKEYEYYYERKIKGSELTTLINKVVDNNTKNEIPKENNQYIDDNMYCIKIDIKLIENEDKLYNMEKIYALGMEQFITYFGYIEFKCTQIEYHKETKRVKYLLFEQLETTSISY